MTAMAIASPSLRSSKKTTNATAGSSQMLSHDYQKSSHNQYSSHGASIDLLTQCIERQQRRQTRAENGQQQHWADLGSADGTNSLNTMEYCLQTFQQKQQSDHDVSTKNQSMQITFCEHPDSDQELLEKTLQNSQLWKKYPEASHSVHMQSFYEQIFPNQSMDLALSHICVQWLDRANVEDLLEWKQLVSHNVSLKDFTMINEGTCPPELQQAWREQLSIPHLSRFYQCRAHELKVDGECFVTMPANPHQFVSSDGPGILTRALQTCVEQGTVPVNVLERTIVPVYLRQVEDIQLAVEHANRALLQQHEEKHAGSSTRTPAPQLELVNVRSDPTLTGNPAAAAKNGQGHPSVGPATMFWSIMAGAVRSAGLLPDQEVHVKKEVYRLFEETFPTGVVEGQFIAATVRRVEQSSEKLVLDKENENSNLAP